MKLTFITTPSPHPARQLACKAVMDAPDGYVVTIQEPKRTLEQNALLWVLLGKASELDWYGQKLTPEEWKDVFTAALEKQKVVPGIDGGFVVCGQRTSKMSKRQLGELVELIYAFGAERGINFDDVKYRAGIDPEEPKR